MTGTLLFSSFSFCILICCHIFDPFSPSKPKPLGGVGIATLMMRVKHQVFALLVPLAQAGIVPLR